MKGVLASSLFFWVICVQFCWGFLGDVQSIFVNFFIGGLFVFIFYFLRFFLGASFFVIFSLFRIQVEYFFVIGACFWVERRGCLGQGFIDVGGNCFLKLSVIVELVRGSMGFKFICCVDYREVRIYSDIDVVLRVLNFYKFFLMDFFVVF